MSKIQWTDLTQNPLKEGKEVDGKLQKNGNYCEKISPGCAFCFASDLNSKETRFGGNGKNFGGVRPADRPEMWLDIPMLRKWERIRKPRKIFVGSMTDVFGEWIPDWMLFAMLDAMTNSVATFQLLTKRPERAGAVIVDWLYHSGRGKLPANIWLGTSAENQKYYDERVLWLGRSLAQVRFLSLEPLLGPIDLSSHPDIDLVDWVIIGGESGPNARPLDERWILDILDQCRSANIPAFVKQLGRCWARRTGAKDSKGGEPGEWPPELRFRMFPGEAWSASRDN
jgi:protein gp37